MPNPSVAHVQSSNSTIGSHDSENNINNEKGPPPAQLIEDSMGTQTTNTDALAAHFANSNSLASTITSPDSEETSNKDNGEKTQVGGGTVQKLNQVSKGPPPVQVIDLTKDAKATTATSYAADSNSASKSSKSEPGACGILIKNPFHKINQHNNLQPNKSSELNEDRPRRSTAKYQFSNSLANISDSSGSPTFNSLSAR